MNVFESRTLMACMSCLLLLQTAQAQPPATGPEVLPDPAANAPLVTDAPGEAVAGNFFGYTEVDRAFEPLLRLDTRGGKLIGQDGFTRISAFLPFYLESDELIFADVGAMALYNPSGGANLQLGWRTYVEDLDRIFGLSGGYDFDPGHNRDYNQFSISFESLGRYMDFRANGYAPFGNKTNVLSSDLSGPVAFNVNNILLGRVRGIESALTGFDAEVGGPIPLLGRYGVSTYVGMYFFDGSENTGNVTGFLSRTQGQVNDDLTVGVQVSHDSVFDTDVQMQVTWTIPDGLPGRWMRQPRVRDRLVAPVVRSYRVIARNDVLITPEIAINPADFEPFFVVHINPNRTPGTGTGTFEDPFSELIQFDTMAGKPDVDIISVTAREDGTSTQLNTGVTLLNNQRFLSTAVPHIFTAVQGTFDLPGFIGGPLPVISNDAGGNVITFATGHRNIEVAGFEINGSATGNGIFGIDNERALINRNVISGGLNGVRFNNLSGAGVANRSLIDENDFVDNLADGFSVINNAADPLEIFITDNLATGNIGNGFRLQADNGSFIGGRITGNTTANTGIGSSNINNGLALFTIGGELDFFNAVNGWQIGGTDATEVNNFSDNGNFGINVIAMAGGDTSLRIINNDVSRNSLNGFGIFADSGAHTLLIGGNDPTFGNRFENNGLNGNLLDLTGDSVTNFNIQNNLFSQNGAGGAGGGGGGGGPVSLYDIDVVFTGGLTASQQAIFAIAAARWESIIIGDLPDVGAIDDLEITAEGADIDGSGGILGSAGPNGLRPGTFLPFSGGMQFDTADLADLEAAGQLDEVILHEMGHVMGFGTIWTQLGLLTGAGTNDPRFIGANAMAEYDARFAPDPAGVPVENTGGPGTADGHWLETVFDNELMTGFLNPGQANPISRVTVGQWQDLGYQVNYAAADPYVVAPSNRPAIRLGDVSGQDLVVAPRTAAPAFTGNLVDPGAAIGDGINISITDAAVVTPSTILDNTITQSARHGIYATTNAGVVVPNLEIRRNDITNNGTGTIGSGVFIDRFDSSTITVTMDSNTVTDNLGDGLTANAQGVAFGGVTINSFDNVYSSNNGNGVNLQAAGTADITFNSSRDTMNENTLNGGFALSEDSTVVTLNLHNITASNNTLDGFEIQSADLSLMDVLIDSPVDPLFLGTSSIFNSNDQNGLHALARERSQFILNIDETIFQANAADGINLVRDDTSLMQVTMTDVSALGNSSDGLEFFFAGARHTDVDQPLPGTPNTLDITDSSFNSNIRNGMHVEGHADGVLLANILSTTFSGNNQAGVFVETFEDASFGVDATLAGRSTFDNITVSGNANNGMRFDTNTPSPFGSFAFVNINADSGDTLISGNTGDGIEINAAGNTTDMIIQGDTNPAAPEFTTQIMTNTGDGIEINVTTDANILIRDVIIGGDTAAQGNGGDGVDVNNDGIGGVITIGAAGDTTIIRNNDGDGVSFNQDGTSTPDRISAVITNTQILDNDGHGLSMVSDGVLSEVFADSRYFLSLTDSEIRRNGLNGVNIVLNGHNLANVFTIDNNVINNNGTRGTDRFNTNGVFVQLNAQDTLKTDGFLFDRVETADTGTWAPPAPGVSSVHPDLTILPNYNAPYLNLSTALQARLNFTRNIVSFNGNDTIGFGDGLYLRVSTNSQLDADVGGSSTTPTLGNVFSGNTLADFRTGSFLATASGRGTGGAAGTVLEPPAGTDGDPDVIFLDDTAQLDLRFKNNDGTDLNPSINEIAVYTNSDPAKGTLNTFREVHIFQVDGPSALLDSTNDFTLPGFPGATESTFFLSGGYRIRSIEDPLFPNPAFPQNFAADPFDPWLD